MRIGRSLVVIGIVVIILSFAGSTQYGSGWEMEYGTYGGIMVRTAGDFNLTVTTLTGVYIDLYIFEYGEALDVIRSGAPENHTPLLERKNITLFSEIVVIPRPSWYAVLVTAVKNESIYVDFSVRKILPQKWLLVAGAVIMSMGISILGLVWVRKRHQRPKRRTDDYTK